MNWLSSWRERDIILAVFAVTITAVAYFGVSRVLPPIARVRVEPDTRPAFVVDPSRPFVIEMGRGSGWDGVDTIRIDETGRVVLHRLYPDFETTTLQLTASQLQSVVDAANANSLTSMGRSYINPDIQDGTQWVAGIKQQPFEKSIYFSNIFPDQILDFANAADDVLQQAGLSNASWVPVSREQEEAAQKAFWERWK